MSNYTPGDLGDTIVALSTPQGIGAIGVIRLSGNKAIALCDEVFEGKRLSKQASHTLHFGKIKDSEKLLDEVVIALFKSPKSYTKEDVVEVSCHGSPYILQSVLNLFIQKGARLAKPGEFTMRAFLNGRLDLSQAEAVADLIASESEGQHQLAMAQMRGGFSQAIQQLRTQLIDFAALLELELDFGEEDVEFADRKELKNLVLHIQQLIRELMQSFRLGNAIKEGVPVVIAGKPNAGKSTLLNALLNDERAIVSPIAGTTRDTIEDVLVVEGIKFRLIDTAGIRQHSQDSIEEIGIRKTFDKIKAAQIVLYLCEANPEPESVGENPQQALNNILQLQKRYSGKNFILCINKVDLHPAPLNLTDSNEAISILSISATQQTNILELKNKMLQTVLKGQTGYQNESIVTNSRHYEALHQANLSLTSVLQGLNNGLSGDLVALDIRHTLRYLGEIIGVVDMDTDILGTIFGRFCIGK